MRSPTKILAVFGTRPEAIKLFPVLRKLAEDERFASRACITAQHRGMLDQVLAIAEVQPDHDLDLMVHQQTLDQLTAMLITKIGEVIDAEKPDWVLVQGDTTTAMAGTLAAYYRKVPTAHVEAGLRSGNIHHPWPEEGNRKIIGSLAVLHFAPTETAASALRAENVPSGSIHVTGNTVIDALHWVTSEVARRPDLAAALSAPEQAFAGKRIIAVTSHRRENFGQQMEQIADAIRRLATRDDLAIIFPVHLNPNVRSVMHQRLADLQNVALLEPLDYPNFARLLDLATLVLTDSGGVQEEAPALGKPVLVMRETTERPEGIIAGTAKLVGTDADRIVAEVTRLLEDEWAYQAMARAHSPFGDGKASGRIVDLLAQAVA